MKIWKKQLPALRWCGSSSSRHSRISPCALLLLSYLAACTAAEQRNIEQDLGANPPTGGAPEAGGGGSGGVGGAGGAGGASGAGGDSVGDQSLIDQGAGRDQRSADDRSVADSGRVGEQGINEMGPDEMGTSDDLGGDLNLPPGECVGPAPAGERTSEVPIAGEPVPDPTLVGSTPPLFRLEERLPNACGFGENYGIDSFRGEVTFVALLSATCGYCLTQLQRLEQLRLELSLEGHRMNWVLINYSTTADAVQNFIDRSGAFHILQDTIEINAWEALAGDKDDFYLYNRDGTLGAFLNDTESELESGLSWLYLSDPVGYENLRRAILDVLEAQPPRE
ncbi:MAG: redoxin family protein [Myxococcota bacterium]|nr:redoxin family protein [Myxococcota bacterium]